MTALLVASIVAGEVGTSVPDARMLVACQVVRDARANRNLSQRWYGWRTPGAADIAAAELALAGGCGDIPRFRFLGNENDLAIWKRLGYVDSTDALMRVGPVVGVLHYTWREMFAARGYEVR